MVRAGRRVGGRSVIPVVTAVAAGTVLAGLLVLPVAALVLRVAPAVLLERIASPGVTEALRLSLLSAAIAALVSAAGGMPVAYLLATRRFPGRRAVEVLVELPMVLPPVVAGLGLLLAFGRAGVAGRALAGAGIEVAFSTVAVVLAQVFVGAPFFIAAARAAFERVERDYLDAAAGLGASPARAFARVTLPLALPSLAAGTAMAWARAMGEFGATITFAGNLPGRTQTLPLALYVALQTDVDAAVALGVVLLLASVSVLLALRAALPTLVFHRGR